jgi:hypothetical protein
MGKLKIWSSYTGMLCCVVMSAVPSISKDHSTSNFRVAQPKRGHVSQLDSVYYTGVSEGDEGSKPTGVMW